MIVNSDLFSSMQLSYKPPGSWKLSINLVKISNIVSEEIKQCI